MESASASIWFFRFAVLAIVLSLHYVHFYFLHKIYGSKITKIRKLKGKLQFKTSKTVFQIDKARKKLMYKGKRERSWMTVSFEDIHDIHVVRREETGSLVEFFFGGFSLFDFMRKYRDRIHSCEINLSVPSGYDDMNTDITLTTLKQYEQREFFLGQLFHDFDVWLMTKLGFYQSLNKNYESKVNEFVELFGAYGLKLKYTR